MSSEKNVIAALRIITASVRVVDAELATVPKRRKGPNATITPVNADAVRELPDVIANAVHPDFGTTTEADANLATVTRNSLSVSDVIQKLANALVFRVLSVTSVNLVRIVGCWFKAKAVSNAIPARTICWM